MENAYQYFYMSASTH